jgi:hypothetical protein
MSKIEEPGVDDATMHASHCLVCRETIRAGASKCLHCGSFQNWRRHFDVGSSVLTSLITLFSVLGLAIPAVVRVMYFDDSRLNTVMRGLGGGTDDFKSKTIVYKIWNEGVRQGEISDVSLELRLAGTRHVLRMYETTGKKIFIDPGKVEMVTFAVLPGDIIPLKKVLSSKLQKAASMKCVHSVKLYGFKDNRAKIVHTAISSTDCQDLLASYLKGDS